MTYAYTPTPHQLEDKDRMLEYEHAYLWADPGTGKTFTTIIAIKEGGYKRVVIICPKIAMTMWYEELKKHLGWDAHVFRSGRFLKGVNWFYKPAVIISYDLFARNKDLQKSLLKYAQGYEEYRSRKKPKGVDYFREKKPLHVLVLDEAHYVKNHESLRAKAIFHRTITQQSFAWHFSDIWQLTGTPITRHVDDLYQQLMPGRDHILEAYGIKSLFDFRKKFCRIEYKSYNPRMQAKPVVTGSKNLDELERLLKDCAVIRRKLADVVENLPPITYRTISVGFKNVEHVKLPGDPAALIRELNKPDSGLSKIRRKLGVAKASDAIEYLTETAAGPTLVGFWHIDVGAAYVEAFADTNFRIGYIDGSTPQHIREQYISEFNDNKLDFLFGQIKAMGVAANLQEAAERVALVEEVLSPAELEQFVARVYRRGQKRHVQVDLIRSNHDLDEAMLGVRLSKEATIERVI